MLTATKQASTVRRHFGAAGHASPRDIALQLRVKRALGKSDQRLLRLMTKQVGVTLRASAKTDL